MKKKRLTLDDLKISSFVTSADDFKAARGGSEANVCVETLEGCTGMEICRLCPDTFRDGSCRTTNPTIGTSIIGGCCIADTTPQTTCPL